MDAKRPFDALLDLFKSFHRSETINSGCSVMYTLALLSVRPLLKPHYCQRFFWTQGYIRIGTQGIFGIQARAKQSPQTNDITAWFVQSGSLALFAINVQNSNRVKQSLNQNQALLFAAGAVGKLWTLLFIKHYLLALSK